MVTCSSWCICFHGNWVSVGTGPDGAWTEAVRLATIEKNRRNKRKKEGGREGRRGGGGGTEKKKNNGNKK